MSVGANRHYKILDVHGRHFVETAKEAGLGQAIIRQVLDEIRRDALPAAERALSRMPADFHTDIYTSVVDAMTGRLRQLETAFEAI